LLWRTAVWMRSCAICKALMKKLRLSDSVQSVRVEAAGPYESKAGCNSLNSVQESKKRKQE
jgi:hypothetical protein